MSEKSRLKDSDEILNSLGRGLSKSGKQDEPAAAPRTRSRRAAPPVPERSEGPALNFEKYEFNRLHAEDSPSARGVDSSASANSDTSAEAGTPSEVGGQIPEWILSQMAEEAKAAETGEKTREQKRGRGRPPKKQNRDKDSNNPPAEDTRTAEPEKIAPPQSEPAPDISELDTSNLDGVKIEEYSFESFDDSDNKPSAPRIPDNPPTTAAREAAVPTGDPRSRLLVDDDERDVFMKELSQRFERRFAEKFETPLDESDDTEKKPTDIPDFWNVPSADKAKTPVQPPMPEENPDEEIAPEAEEFVGRFMNETFEEEENRSRDFKDTLAQKFMRERERYLKELEMAAKEIPEEAQPPEEESPKKPQRRKLDYQIVPEMHLREGEAPPSNPVTYTRDARLRPQSVPDEPDEVSLPAEAKNPPVSSSKKSAEQLLNELAAQTKAAQDRLGMSQSLVPQKRGALRKNAGKTTSKPIKSNKPANRTVTKQAVIFSAAAFMLLTTVVLWTFRDVLFTQTSPIVQNSEIMSQSSQSSGNDTLTVYEDRRFTERGNYGDVLVKRPNVSLGNLSVRNLLVISDIETAGEVSLRDVNVDGAIHVKSCAVNVLNLADVKASRVVINNTEKNMLVRISGDSDIGEIEMRTPGIVEQTELSGDSLGVRGIVTDSGDVSGAMSVTLTGLNLPSLTSSGETAFKFSDSYVGNMVSGASISIEGTGRIANLSAGTTEMRASNMLASPMNFSAAVRPMALTETKNTPISLIIKGVAVSNLTLRGSGEINISSPVEIMTVSDNVSITGEATIGNLTVNRNSGGSRIAMDIAGVNVPALTAEAEIKLTVSGTGKVNNLICNASAYAFGNKINKMIVNADGCVYEKMPDIITRAEGVRPPESVAENPNLDYNAAAASSAPDSDDETSEAEEAVGTSCGHTRENGGFINGDGSKSNPFEVSSPAQLAHVAQHLNSFFIQTKDLDIADDSAFSDGFPVIAHDDDPFSGEYNGMGFSIKNLRITSGGKIIGLFGSNIGIIQNINLLSGEITSTMAQGAYVGGIAGFNYNGGQVLNCANRAKVTGKLSYVGGITGYNYGGRIKDCYNAAKITADSDAGGIVGVNRQDGSVAGCYNVGTISAEAPAGAVAGTNEAKIINCYYLEDTAESGIGRGDGSAIMKTSEELMDANFIDELAAGNLDTPWQQADPYPGLRPDAMRSAMP